MTTEFMLAVDTDGEVTALPWPEGDFFKAMTTAIDCRYVEILGSKDGAATLWFDDEGKLKPGWTPNITGTTIAREYAWLDASDIIAGRMIITGGADDNGDTLPLTIDAADHIIGDVIPHEDLVDMVEAL